MTIYYFVIIIKNDIKAVNMNMKLYTTEKVKFDKYGYALKEITMDYSYGETFLVYSFINEEAKQSDISIPTVNEVIVKNKNILKTAIELMEIFPDDMMTILGCLPCDLVSNNKLILAKLNDSKEYRRILNNKVEKHTEKLANSVQHI